MSDIRRFKIAQRPGDRPASADYKNRWNEFIEAFVEKQELDSNEIIDLRLELGLVYRTFMENYLNPAIQRGIIESVRRQGRIIYRVCNSAPSPKAPGGKPLEKRYNIETMRYEYMPAEEPPETPFTDYVKLNEVNTVRQKMGLKPLKVEKK